jgi:hypothetical protein
MVPAGAIITASTVQINFEDLQGEKLQFADSFEQPKWQIFYLHLHWQRPENTGITVCHPPGRRPTMKSVCPCVCLVG